MNNGCAQHHDIDCSTIRELCDWRPHVEFMAVIVWFFMVRNGVYGFHIYTMTLVLGEVIIDIAMYTSFCLHSCRTRMLAWKAIHFPFQAWALPHPQADGDDVLIHHLIIVNVRSAHPQRAVVFYKLFNFFVYFRSKVSFPLVWLFAYV